MSSQLTKRALEESLKRLLREKPLSKITIADITDDCGSWCKGSPPSRTAPSRPRSTGSRFPAATPLASGTTSRRERPTPARPSRQSLQSGSLDKKPYKDAALSMARRPPRPHHGIRRAGHARRARRKGAAMYYSSGNYEAFARPKKPAGIEHKSAYIVGTGLAALSAACCLVRDAQMPGKNIHIFEKDSVP